MSDVQVRPFRRGDRDQLTRLVNAHAEAVVPGMSVSVNTVLGSLERQPEEFIVDPWVSERVTLVAEQRSRVAAAAHLLRYYPDDRAGPAFRDAGEIYWLLYWPLAPAGNPFWPDVTGAAEALIAACIEIFGRWGVTRQYAGGELPVPGVYGVPEQWPHIAALYRRAAVVCLPSVHLTCYGRRVQISELLGLAAIEAMASGTPVICSRLGGLPEVVRHGETGFLVEPGNAAELRDRVATVLADRRLARRLGDNARLLALERFTWQACAQRCLAAYPPMTAR